MTRNCAGSEAEDQTVRGTVWPSSVEALRPVLADLVQLPAAAGAVQARGLDGHLDPGQIGRKVAAVALRGGTPAAPARAVIGLRHLLRFELGDRRLTRPLSSDQWRTWPRSSKASCRSSSESFSDFFP